MGLGFSWFRLGWVLGFGVVLGLFYMFFIILELDDGCLFYNNGRSKRG